MVDKNSTPVVNHYRTQDKQVFWAFQGHKVSCLANVHQSETEVLKSFVYYLKKYLMILQ